MLYFALTIFLCSDTVCKTSGLGVCEEQSTCRGSAAVCEERYKPSSMLALCVYCVLTRLCADFECRPAANVCDLRETCTGNSRNCPNDILRPNGFQCRASAGVCDIAETCVNGNCPSDSFAGNSRVCRTANRACEDDARCGGNGANDCPANGPPKSIGTACGPNPRNTAAEMCALRGQCDGSGLTCPGLRPRSNGFVCRPSAGPCDVDDVCDGSSLRCDDGREPNSKICNNKNDDCGLPSNCDGGTQCPARPFKGSSIVCRAQQGVCDKAETCTGSSYNCPSDLNDVGKVCRPAAGVCDVEEKCTAESKSCPADDKEPTSTRCQRARLPCDVDDFCDGYVDDSAVVRFFLNGFCCLLVWATTVQPTMLTRAAKNVVRSTAFATCPSFATAPTKSARQMSSNLPTCFVDR